MTTAPRWFIRRRTLFAFGLGSLGALGACAKGDNPAPSGPSASAPTTKGSALPKPSGNDAVPARFAKTPSWSSGNVPFEIYAVHTHYVCGVAEAVQFAGLEKVVVVDVAGPNVWSVEYRDAKFTSSAVELSQLASTSPDEPELSLEAALLDDAHAYLLVTVFEKSATRTVSLVKMRLDDGSVVASAAMSKSLNIHSRDEASLAFSRDRAELLLAGADGDDFLGLRVSAEDLTVRFDAAKAFSGPPETVEVFGEGIRGYGDSLSGGEEMVFLATGKAEPSRGQFPVMVHDGWYYYQDLIRYGRGLVKKGTAHARDVATGRDVEILGYDLGGLKPADPKTNQTELVHTSGMKWAIRSPGAAKPTLERGENKETAVRAVCVFGGVVYAVPLEASGGSPALRLISLESGRVIATGPELAWGKTVTVTAWGLVTAGGFFPATEWFDGEAPTVAPESPGSSPS